jgi:DNA segregation ATPase FtsK/SpoIIIE-like protein
MANLQETAKDLKSKVETCLQNFNITSRVDSINFENKFVLLKLTIAPDINIENIKSLSSTIAMAVASPTGKVSIMAPIAGTSHIGIKVPLAN